MAIFRLNKLAKDFNVGIQTLVDYLAQKGHQVELSPNTKISEEQYELIIMAFQGERKVKEEADRIELITTDTIQEMESNKDKTAGLEQGTNSTIKVVGKKDLSALNQRMRPDKRKRKKRKPVIAVKPVPEFIDTQYQILDTIAVKPEPEFIYTQYQKLEGPKVLDKIDLGQFSKYGADIPGGNERKRKHTKKEAVSAQEVKKIGAEVAMKEKLEKEKAEKDENNYTKTRITGVKENGNINQRGEKYDVFISYRRDGGKDFARIIKPELINRKIRVFLDFDELKDGVFNKRIMDAIEDAPVFMLILSKGCLDRCKNDKDWIKEEILHADKFHRHIVPVEVDKTFREVPKDIPQEVRSIISQHQFSQIDTETLLEASMNELVERRIRPYINGPSTKTETELQGAEVHIETDTNCKILRFWKEIGVAKVGEDNVVVLKKGKHKLTFESLEKPNIKQTNIIEIPDIDYSDFVEVKLK